MKAINTLYVPSELAKSGRLNAGELFILSNIGYNCAVHGYCSDRVYHKEGRSSFAELLGRNGSSISRTIHALADKGYLTVEQTMHNGKKSFLRITGTSKLMAFFIKDGKRLAMSDRNNFIPVKLTTIKAVGVKLAYTLSLIACLLHNQRLLGVRVSLGKNFHERVGVSRNTLTNHLKALERFIGCTKRVVKLTVAGATLCLKEAALKAANGLLNKAGELFDIAESGSASDDRINSMISFITRTKQAIYSEYGVLPLSEEIDEVLAGMLECVEV